jgi:DNA-binding HxlR family transcriptional regulator
LRAKFYLLMPKVVLTAELEKLTDLVARFPEGARLGELAAALGGEISRRTLQRRLAELVNQRRIVPHGAGRSVKYRVAPATGTIAVTEADNELQATGEVYVPTSPEGEEIKAYVRQPVQRRRPVGYNLEFLESYTPNDTWYLPKKLRDQLHAMGHPPAEHALAGTFAQNILNRLLIDLSWGLFPLGRQHI